MTRRDIEQRARMVIAQTLICHPSRAIDSAEFKMLGADDGDMAEVKLAVEAEFGIRITLRELAFSQTVGTLIDLVETKLENRACGAGPSATAAKAQPKRAENRRVL